MKKPRVTGISPDGWPIIDPDSVDWAAMEDESVWDRPNADAVRIDEIPYLDVSVDVGPHDGLRVWADGLEARIFIRGRGFASDKIVIEFEQPHPRFDTTFATKYFAMDEPGVLSWGHEDQMISISRWHAPTPT